MWKGTASEQRSLGKIYPEAIVIKYYLNSAAMANLHLTVLFAVIFRELIRCLKWYMDRSAELVRQDHIQEAMRVCMH